LRCSFVGNIICAKLTVSSRISDGTGNVWSKTYDAMVDTGAWNTAIPAADIEIPNGQPNLKYTGTHYTTGLGWSGNLALYEATLLIGEEDTYYNSEILATPHNFGPVIGREIISQYRWDIDYKSKMIKVSKYT
jgi:Retroviral aspartyl protease